MPLKTCCRLGNGSAHGAPGWCCGGFASSHCLFVEKEGKDVDALLCHTIRNLENRLPTDVEARG